MLMSKLLILIWQSLFGPILFYLIKFILHHKMKCKNQTNVLRLFRWSKTAFISGKIVRISSPTFKFRITAFDWYWKYELFLDCTAPPAWSLWGGDPTLAHLLGSPTLPVWPLHLFCLLHHHVSKHPRLCPHVGLGGGLVSCSIEVQAVILHLWSPRPHRQER